MSVWQSVRPLCLVFLFSTAHASEEAVKSTVLRHFKTLSARDQEALVKNYSREFSAFTARGGLLREGVNRTRVKSAVKAGVKLNFEPRHLDVKLFDNLAVVTGYLTGGISSEKTRPGKIRTLRMSSVLVNEEGDWRLVHTHLSSLIVAPDSQASVVGQVARSNEQNSQGLGVQDWLLAFLDIIY
jgi:ketosteroid isomerase-like protein